MRHSALAWLHICSQYIYTGIYRHVRESESDCDQLGTGKPNPTALDLGVTRLLCLGSRCHRPVQLILAVLTMVFLCIAETCLADPNSTEPHRTINKTLLSPHGGEGYGEGNVIPVSWDTKAFHDADLLHIDVWNNEGSRYGSLHVFRTDQCS